jgi:hypothetical protein
MLWPGYRHNVLRRLLHNCHLLPTLAPNVSKLVAVHQIRHLTDLTCQRAIHSISQV